MRQLLALFLVLALVGSTLANIREERFRKRPVRATKQLGSMKVSSFPLMISLLQIIIFLFHNYVMLNYIQPTSRRDIARFKKKTKMATLLNHRLLIIYKLSDFHGPQAKFLSLLLFEIRSVMMQYYCCDFCDNLN